MDGNDSKNNNISKNPTYRSLTQMFKLRHEQTCPSYTDQPLSPSVTQVPLYYALTGRLLPMGPGKFMRNTLAIFV